MGKKVGICLPGGGARGAYQIGALKALEDLGIFSQVRAFSGTSIGAANAAVVASRSIEDAFQIWLTIPEDNLPKISDYKDVNDEVKRKRLAMDRGIYSMEIFEAVMVDAVNYEAIRSKEVYVTISEGGDAKEGLFELVKASYSHYIKKETKVHYIPLHKVEEKVVHQSIIASCSIPFFFAPVTYEEKKYYDGGVFDNVPIKPLIDAGCDEIIIIHLHKNRFYKPKHIETGITIHEIKHHKGHYGKILKFSKEQTKRLYTLGYEDTKAYYEALNITQEAT